jgi:hypothetical protein
MLEESTGMTISFTLIYLIEQGIGGTGNGVASGSEL